MYPQRLDAFINVNFFSPSTDFLPTIGLCGSLWLSVISYYAALCLGTRSFWTVIILCGGL